MYIIYSCLFENRVPLNPLLIMVGLFVYLFVCLCVPEEKVAFFGNIPYPIFTDPFVLSSSLPVCTCFFLCGMGFSMYGLPPCKQCHHCMVRKMSTPCWTLEINGAFRGVKYKRGCDECGPYLPRRNPSVV